MKIIYFLFLALLLGRQTYAQSCDCLHSFNTLVKKVELNYPGFPDWVTPTTKDRYQEINDSLRRVATHSNKGECLLLLNAYTSFFQDPHLGVDLIDTDSTENQIREVFNKWPKMAWSEKQTKTYLDKSGRNPLEGIWQLAGGNYRIAIVRDKGSLTKFTGFILKADSVFWTPGQIKMRIVEKDNWYAVTGYQIDHSPQHFTARLNKTTLAIQGFGNWFKIYPSSTKNIAPSSHLECRFAKLNNEANLLTLPSFAYRYKKQIDSIIKANQASILNAPLLIVDIRNNGGGSVSSFNELLPYLYTNPIKTQNVSILATDDNITMYEEVLASSTDSSYRESITNMLATMKAQRGKMVNVFSSDTIVYDTIYPYPSKVAFITNNGTVSAAEMLLYRGKQSKKTITFGQATRGGLDYLNISDPMPLDCSIFGLVYPTLRSDEVVPGKMTRYQPDVPITSIPDDKWVDFVLKWFKKEKL